MLIIDDSFRSVLEKRKTLRDLVRGRMPRQAFNDLIWAAYGVTHTDKSLKMRTAPSAGATYPIEITCAIEEVDGLENGIYHYDTRLEEIWQAMPGRHFGRIQAAALDQEFIIQSNLIIFMVYNPAPIVPEYGEDSFKYAAFECGHIAQNVTLMATSLGMGSVPVGAFDQRQIAEIIGVTGDKEVMYLVVVGMPG
jgi:SagB-type dehydrogenase family enzyme